MTALSPTDRRRWRNAWIRAGVHALLVWALFALVRAESDGSLAGHGLVAWALLAVPFLLISGALGGLFRATTSSILAVLAATLVLWPVVDPTCPVTLDDVGRTRPEVAGVVAHHSASHLPAAITAPTRFPGDAVALLGGDKNLTVEGGCGSGGQPTKGETIGWLLLFAAATLVPVFFAALAADVFRSIAWAFTYWRRRRGTLPDPA